MMASGELARSMAAAKEARRAPKPPCACGAAKARKLEAENKRLRKALEPITSGVFFLSDADVRRAYKALGKECPFSVKLAQSRA